MKKLIIGDISAKIPVIQGGMGVGISRSSLAGAVAAEGGIGVISTAQIGYDEEGFEQDQAGCNLRAITKHIKRAKEIAAQADNGGLVGVNIMVALKHYADHVRASVKAGADVIISGAGLPIDLPELVGAARTKIAPIVSSAKATSVILRMWEKKYKRTADFIVVEGPRAGGHLGFTAEEAQGLSTEEFDEEIRKIIETKSAFEEKFGQKIPCIIAGGIFTKEDVAHAMELGADGVQVATRFVVTKECDAAQAYKDAYLNAKEEDVTIIKSPVGMPGRALNNAFIKKVSEGRQTVHKCYQCIKSCNPAEIPYCITEALTNAVRGDMEHGLIFCGSRVGELSQMSTVHEVMTELAQGF